jgi:hypothetical protein
VQPSIAEPPTNGGQFSQPSMLLHRFPTETAFEEQMRLNQFDYLQASEHAQASLAEQYVGLPFEA